MTVCVVAMCGGNILFGASDRMLTSGDVEFEPEISKIYEVTNSITAMIAGDESLQSEILQDVFCYASKKIEAAPKVWVSVVEVANEYHLAYERVKSRRAEHRILRPLNLTVDEFIKRQKEMTDSTVTELTREILNFDMPGIQAIVTGVDSTGAHIYVVDNREVTCRDAIGFAAIGAGYWHADSQFMFAGHNRNKPIAETFLLTYAAKKRAEVAPGVGVGTDMFTMGPLPGSYGRIPEDRLQEVDRIYKRVRIRSAEAIEQGNDEGTQYVEQLGKKGAEQQQKNPTPEPTDRPDGKKKAA